MMIIGLKNQRKTKKIYKKQMDRIFKTLLGYCE